VSRHRADSSSRFLRGWNRRDARAIAALFAADGGLVGFDGSEVGGGPPGVEAHLAPIFRDHATAAYVGIVRGVQALGPDALIVRAVVGMVPPGGDDVRSDVNAIQTLVAVREGDA
jgi:uncharacterized protein (TIGR02246 family)